MSLPVPFSSWLYACVLTPLLGDATWLVGHLLALPGVNLRRSVLPDVLTTLSHYSPAAKPSLQARHVLGFPQGGACTQSGLARALRTDAPCVSPAVTLQTVRILSIPTPPLLCCGPLRRTSSPARGHPAASHEEVLAPIFEERERGILPTLVSPPPRSPTARRKTIVGVKISNKGGIVFPRKVKHGGPCLAISAAKAAEKLLCFSLGIVRDGEDVTEATLVDFTAQFKDQLAPEVIFAMRDFFHLDDPATNNIEEALIDHGGEAALERTQDDVGAQLNVGP
ncbi:hypothetical protein ZWY2020_056217 [Hordeum vulgare]|nr:hypothetical protein ZWY2020_056217 [Hordeum vulgare]